MSEGKPENAVKRKRRLQGTVVCDKSDKTVRVRVVSRVKHPLYEKIVRRHRHVQAHDAENAFHVGDVVTVEESPRFSKTKGWLVVSGTQKGGAV